MISSEQIKTVLKNNKIKRPILKNAFFAFLVGGIVGLIGESLMYLFKNTFELEVNVSSTLMYMVVIFIASLLTGFGIFDNIGQFSGAGTFIPITGFANSMTSSAIESKSEGLVLGVLTNMLKLAGAVIVTAVISAIIVSVIVFINL